MKLHRIVVENLNSLYGRHTIDLDGGLGDPPFFLIVGPTGAGKTTLTDAVMLALYGETPRLDRGRGEDKLKPHHIISRGQGEALAEVEVSRVEPDGGRTRYRATWYMHRAHKRAEGEPKPPRRTLAVWDPAALTWVEKASSDKKKDIQSAFDALVEGLGAAEFKRSMLLAQGEFAAFIEADDDDRAAILERLTATDRYRRLGARAYARRHEAQRRLEGASAKHQAIEVLPEAAEVALAAAWGAAGAAAQEADRALAEVQAARQWRQLYERLAASVADARRVQEAALATWEAAGPELARLAEHRRCAAAASPLGAREEARRELAQTALRLAALETQRAAAEREVQTATLALDRARAERLAEEGRWALVAPTLAEARRGRHALALAESEAERARGAAEQLAGWATQFERGQAALAAAQQAARTAREAALARAAEVAANAEARVRLDGLAGERLAQTKAFRGALEAVAWALQVATERQRLAPGAPCPLCGSAHHPYVDEGTHAAADATHRARHAETAAALAAAEAAEQAARRELAGAQAEGARLAAERAAAEREVETHARAARDVGARLAEVRRALGLAAGAREAGDVAGDLAVIHARRAEVEAARLHAEAAREAAAAAVAALAVTGDPDFLEAQHRQTLERLGRTEQHLVGQLHGAETRLAEAVARRQEATAREAALGAAITAHGVALAALAVALAVPEAELPQRLLPPAQAEALTRREAELQRQLREAQTIHDDRRQRLQAHLTETPSGREAPEGPALGTLTQAELTALVEARARVAHAARAQHAELGAQHAHNAQTKARRDALASELAPLRAEAKLWSELADLIGAGEGAEFRRFAQMLNLADLAARANVHLARLAPRYQLVTPETEPGRIRLDFAIADSLHAGARRPLTTLSGGESFLVSLALALALASYRTQRLRIETLLIDEGFGGLDPEALEVSIQALETLHAQGMQVGLISHVEALRDRIDARVVVQPVGGGRSVIRLERGPSGL